MSTSPAEGDEHSSTLALEPRGGLVILSYGQPQEWLPGDPHDNRRIEALAVQAKF